MVIVGGTSWQEEKNQAASKLVKQRVEAGTPIAAICDGVTFLANYGYLDQVKHTGNTVDYLKKGAPNYKGEEYFVEAQSVSDGNFITANGTACLEFGRDILAKLSVLENDDLRVNGTSFGKKVSIAPGCNGGLPAVGFYGIIVLRQFHRPPGFPGFALSFLGCKERMT